MLRMAMLWAFGGSLLATGAGCSHLLEARTIAQFTQELSRGDLDALRSATSVEFERKALRSPEALDDLQVLNLPTEQPSVVRVKDSSETEKLVEVQVGESGRKLLYKLVRDEESKRWLVDDIYVRQKHDGITATRSVTQQMDLLLTVRDFLRAWREGDRDEALRVATPEFNQTLGELPPTYLAALTREIIGEGGDRKSKPRATVDHDSARVEVPRAAGKLVVSCALQGGEWKVSDVAVESRDASERIPSVRAKAEALLVAVRFLDSYAAGDKRTLEQCCASALFGSLKLANLAEVPLPDSRAALPRHELRLLGHKAEFEVPGRTQILKIALERPLLERELRGEETVEERGPYQVQSVTLYQLDGTQERRLSAVFTAEPVMELFAEAFSRRDLGMLRRLSTLDFRTRLWDRIETAALEDSAFDVISREPPRVVSTNFRGAVTEITVMQGERPMTYVLHDAGGQMCVDDMRLPVPGRPQSLKQTMEILLPVRAYAQAISAGRLERLQQASSDDMNRLVWSQVRAVPESAADAAPLLMLPLARIETRDNGETVVVLGDARRGAEVVLLRERGVPLVDDVFVVAGGERIGMKVRLRSELAERMLAASGPDASGHRPVVGYRPSGSLSGPVHQRPVVTAELMEREDDASFNPVRDDDSRLHTLRSDNLPAIEIPVGVQADERRGGSLPDIPLDDEMGDIELR